MAIQCNIDARGKVVRLVMGVAVVLVGAGMIYFWERWIVGAALVAAGAFMVFEARAGWCVVRAMGVKTPW